MIKKDRSFHVVVQKALFEFVLEIKMTDLCVSGLISLTSICNIETFISLLCKNCQLKELCQLKYLFIDEIWAPVKSKIIGIQDMTIQIDPNVTGYLKLPGMEEICLVQY